MNEGQQKRFEGLTFGIIGIFMAVAGIVLIDFGKWISGTILIALAVLTAKLVKQKYGEAFR